MTRKLAVTEDYDSDERGDMFRRNHGGALCNWLGTASGDFILDDGLYPVPTSWHVQPVKRV